MKMAKNGLIISLVINIALPYLAYTLLIHYTSHVMALSAAALIPLCDSLLSLIKLRRIDVFSSFILLQTAHLSFFGTVYGKETCNLKRMGKCSRVSKNIQSHDVGLGHMLADGGSH